MVAYGKSIYFLVADDRTQSITGVAAVCRNLSERRPGTQRPQPQTGRRGPVGIARRLRCSRRRRHRDRIDAAQTARLPRGHGISTASVTTSAISPGPRRLPSPMTPSTVTAKLPGSRRISDCPATTAVDPSLLKILRRLSRTPEHHLSPRTALAVHQSFSSSVADEGLPKLTPSSKPLPRACRTMS